MIKRIGIILLFLSVLGYNYAIGQEFVATPVEISTEKVNMNGEIFYVHKVLSGHTLFSISKAYEVPTETILGFNPDLKSGLKSGAVIYIPAIEKKSYEKYTVKWYENIHDVSQKFKVPVDALLSLNGLDQNSVLTKRQVLLIPDKEYIASLNRAKKGDLVTTPKGEMTVDTIQVVTTGEVAETLVDFSIYGKTEKRSYKITLVLPFNSKADTKNANKNQLDFYSGALVAFSDFNDKTEGNPYHLNVVDINDYPTVYSMIHSGVLDDSELVIGPIFEKNLAPLANWADQKHIPLVSPLDPKAAYLADNHPYFFHYPPTQETIMEVTYKGVADEAKASEVKPIIIYENGTEGSSMVTGALNELSSQGVEVKKLKYGILEGRGIDTVMVKMMDTTAVNTVFVVSESEAFVSDVLRNLLLAEGTSPQIKVSLYGLPKWKNFEIIELSYFHDLDTHISSQYNINYNTSESDTFVSNFRFNFKTDPTQYAFQGYDIMSYFLSALDTYGRAFPMHIHENEKSLLQSNVRFEKANTESGFTNKGIRNILYSDNWSIKSW